MKKVQEYFASYPTSPRVFATADGFLFHQEGDAKLHANSLDKKGVLPISREEFEAANELESDSVENFNRHFVEKQIEAEKKALAAMGEVDKEVLTEQPKTIVTDTKPAETIETKEVVAKAEETKEATKVTSKKATSAK